MSLSLVFKVCVCLCVWGGRFVHMSIGAQGGQKRQSDPQEQKLQSGCESPDIGVGTKGRSPAAAASACKHWAISLILVLFKDHNSHVSISNSELIFCISNPCPYSGVGDRHQSQTSYTEASEDERCPLPKHATSLSQDFHFHSVLRCKTGGS